MRLSKKIFPFIFVIIFSCGQEAEKEAMNANLQPCNELLGSCLGKSTAYCTFGYKIGDGNPFSPSGDERPGPAIPVTQITFKFQDEGFVFDTHSQNDVVSLAFNEEQKIKIRASMLKWSAVADFEFVEKASGEEADVRIIYATITQNGVGYPAYPEYPCNEIAGNLVLSTRALQPEKLTLHEMGHVLGLGHVSSENVMNPQKTFEDLQEGDILGVQSIYGSK
jgi:hypothetical protein